MQPFNEKEIEAVQRKAMEQLSLSSEEVGYFVFNGIAENRMYNPGNEHINILYKDGTVKDISEIEYGLIHKAIASPVRKFYLCRPALS